MASIVAVAGPPAETPDVCRERTRGAAGTQELHTGKYLGSEYKEQGDRQENSGRRRPASCGAAPHTGKECGQSNCVRRQVGDPGELLLALQILDTLSEPGGHGAPPDGNLDDTDDQHERRRDECSNCPAESRAGTGKPREHNDCSSASDDCNHTTCCPDLCQSQLRRHASRNGRLRSGPVRSDLPRQALVLAHARSIRPWGAHQLRASGIARPPC